MQEGSEVLKYIENNRTGMMASDDYPSRNLLMLLALMIFVTLHIGILTSIKCASA